MVALTVHSGILIVAANMLVFGALWFMEFVGDGDDTSRGRGAVFFLGGAAMFAPAFVAVGVLIVGWHASAAHFEMVSLNCCRGLPAELRSRTALAEPDLVNGCRATRTLGAITQPWPMTW
jgi:hypothetical protein